MPRRPALRPRLEPLEDRTTPTAGDLDPTFGTGGRAFPDLGGFGALYGVATLADGNILVAGETNGFLESDIAVARLTPTGQLDPTFGTGGVYTLDLGGFEYAGGLFPRPDGSVLVSAYSDTPGGAIVVVRLTAGGQPDPTFGAGGLVRAGFGGSFESGGVAGVLADGRIVLAGRSDFDFAAARLTAAGQPDPTFGVGGAVVDTAGPDRDSRAFVLQPDGKVVVVGYTQSGPNPQVAAIRFTSAGQLDPGFGTGGRVQIDFGSFVVPEGVVVQPDGSLVLGGFNDAPGVRDFAALRLTSAGQLDTTFGTAGLAVVDFGFEDSARDVALQPDGAIVLTGSVNTAPVFSFAAARLTPAGQPDPTFGTNGHVFHPYSDFDQAGGGGLQPDGKVLVLGSHLEPGIGSYPMIVRLTTDPAPNTPPSTSDVANQTVPAGGSTGALPVTVSDAETAAASLNLTATSSNPALVPAGAIVLGGSGASRTVTVTPAAGQFGSATITLTVTDGGAMTATDTFTVTVPPPPPNTPPSISDVPNLTVPAGGNTGALPFTVSDAQTAAATLTVTAASSNLALVPMAAIAFGGSGASRTVTVTPAAGQYGTATISVTVTDGGGLTAVDAFTIDVPLPPPPPLPALLPSAPITVAVTGYDTPGNAMSVAAGDFNGDGRPDAVVGNSGGITVFLNDGTGAMENRTDYPTGSSAPRFVRVADLTGDGKPEVIAANDDGRALSIFRGVGDGTFQPAVLVSAGNSNLQGFAVADFNGDNMPDVAVITDTYVAMLLNVGGIGVLGAPVTVSAVGGTALDTADFNGDGQADLVVTDSDGGRLVVYLGAGDGTFDGGLTVPTGVGSRPVGVIARRADGGLLDWNGDGLTDLAAGCSDAGLVEVFVGNGAGGFTLSAVLNPGFPRAGRLAAADFDADGFLDLVVQVSGGGSPTTQPVFVGDGAGGFTGAAQVPIGGDSDVTAADLNGDGRPDILGSLGFSPGSLGVSLNTTPVVASFQVTAPPAAQIGVPFAVTVTAKAAGGATFAGYKGFVRFTSPAGSAVLPPDLRFTPNDNGTKTVMVTLNATGAQSITVRDGVLTGVFATAVVAVNTPPTANADPFTVGEDAAATPVPVLGNDSFAPDAGETLTVTQVTPAAHGLVALAGGVVTYAPDANYFGPDSFTYTISDGNGGTATATVTVTVTAANDPPTAAPDPLTVAEDAAATVVPVLGNDSFAPDAGETLVVSAVGPAANGTVTLVGGVVRYAPNANYFGPDSFTYTVSDGNGGTATGTVSVTVTPVNDAPGAFADTLTVAEDAPVADVPVLSNDTSAEVGETFTVVSVTPAAHGTVTLVGGVVRYAPVADYAGPDFFTYTVSDGNSAAVAAVMVNVSPVNDPPTAAADAFPVSAGGPTTLAVLANDTTAPDAGETLTVTAVTQPTAGGTVAVAPGGGGVEFTPAAGFVGVADFTYTVGDGTPGSAATAAVSVTVRPGGLGPVRSSAVGGAPDGSVRLVAPGGATTVVAPFGNTGTPTRTATGDVNGDGVPDVVAVTGPGTALRVAVLSGADGSVLVAPFDPFGGDFGGGGYVAAGDLDGDGRSEFAVTPDQGGGPRVTVFGMTAGGGRTVRANFFGIDDDNFRGGARAAVGDVNGDGVPDVIVAAGFGGGPRTAIFTGQSVLAGAPVRLVGDFFAFPGSDATNLRNGSFVAAGDVTGDGFADLIFGGGPGGAPRVFVLSGAVVSAGRVAEAQASPVANFFVAGDPTDRGGARVAVTNADGDARADVVVGSGAGRPARVRLYLGKDFAGGGEPPATEIDLLGGAVLADGVYVG